MREILAAVVGFLLVLQLGLPVLAQEVDPGSARHETAVLVPADGVTLRWNDRSYAGSLVVRGASDGLVLIESVDPESYLLGIQEVPFSWPVEALKAQVVAARTYLAWTLRGGRRGSGATYGFDICATDQCQVYGGLDQVLAPGGDRWKDAVLATEGEVLMVGDRPAQTLYSSTSGGRTRSVEDVFGSGPIPYLVAVDSPGEDSPFASWEVRFDEAEMGAILRAADLLSGPLRGLSVSTTPDGEGPWMVEVKGTDVRRVPTWEFRGIMNRWASSLFGRRFPAERPDGRRYPQTVLSPTFTIERRVRILSDPEAGFRPPRWEYFVVGQGWGHLVGMSQYGAKAMADGGSEYAAILEHYYTGLTPEKASALPALVDIGLSWGAAELAITADGPFQVVGDGEVLTEAAIGTWRFTSLDGEVGVEPPAGFGLPPIIREVVVDDTPVGRPVVVVGRLSAPAEVRITVFSGPRVVGSTDWQVWESGRFFALWNAEVAGRDAGAGRYGVLVQARSSAGSDVEFAAFRIGSQPAFYLR